MNLEVYMILSILLVEEQGGLIIETCMEQEGLIIIELLFLITESCLNDNMI